uniref:ANF_receptor domain-containing protein n=1 Tax=Heterorhabditis bacteriophora TaxID=37862 RepID=A0A1I7XER0_HETBA
MVRRSWLCMHVLTIHSAILRILVIAYSLISCIYRLMFSILALATHILANVTEAAKLVDGTDLAPPSKVRQIRIAGDLMIGGVFPVHTKSQSPDEPCGEIAETRGVHRVEAMLYALDQINAQKDFLRGYKLGALILDSCSNPAYALNQSLDFVRDLIGSSEVSDYVCRDGSEPQIRMLNQKKKVVAVVGASYSSVTVQVANLLRLFRIVQVSPASTNADLSDKSRFEYFARMCFITELRFFKNSIPSYSSLIRFLRHHNSILRLQPDKDVGARVVILFVGTEYVPELLKHTAERMKLSAGYSRKKIIWFNLLLYFFTYVNRILLRYICIIQCHDCYGSFFISQIFSTLILYGPASLRLASESWDRNNDKYMIGQNRLAAQGALVLMLASQKVPSFEEYFLSLHPGSEKFERNKWLRELWMTKYKCKFDLSSDSMENRSCWEEIPLFTTRRRSCQLYNPHLSTKITGLELHSKKRDF